MYEIRFIEKEAFKEVVRHTMIKYQSVFGSFNLSDFNSSIIDPVKLLFDNKLNQDPWDETIKKEINRQRDKSNNNEIGTFHQQMFKNVRNCVVPSSGWDVIYSNPNEPFNNIYVELKNKHNTMNSSSAQRTYINMQNQILNNDNCICYLVEVIAKRSQNVKWETTVNNRRVSHNLIRRVSIDKFYEEITGESNAFNQICMALPDLIDEIINEGQIHPIQEDTVIEELLELSDDYLKGLYLLAFSTYDGFTRN